MTVGKKLYFFLEMNSQKTKIVVICLIYLQIASWFHTSKT